MPRRAFYGTVVTPSMAPSIFHHHTFYDAVEAFYDTVATSMTPSKPSITPSHLGTVETAKPLRTFHDTAEAFHVTVETFYDTVAPSMGPPGVRFEYLTSYRVRQSSSFLRLL